MSLATVSVLVTVTDVFLGGHGRAISITNNDAANPIFLKYDQSADVLSATNGEKLAAGQVKVIYAAWLGLRELPKVQGIATGGTVSTAVQVVNY